jgi:hypothetical protein
MKRLFNKFTIFVLKLALRFDGWTDKPRPTGFKPNPGLPFWRYRDGTHGSIESGNLLHACNKSLFDKV